MKRPNISNAELKKLLDWLQTGDPIKDRWEEGELITNLAEDLAEMRKIDMPKGWESNW